MNPYYDIVHLMREQRRESSPFAEGTIHVEPVQVEVMGEMIAARFAGHISSVSLYEGASCLVYMGADDNVVVAVW